MSKSDNIPDRGRETDILLRLLDADKHLDGEALDRLLANQNLDKLKLIAENTLDVICLHHPSDGRYLYASPSTVQIMGYTSENLKGKVPFDFVHPDHHALLVKNISSSTEGVTSIPHKLELKFKTKHHGYQWFEGYTKPIFDKKGKVVLILSCTRNIQDRKMAEMEKRKREGIQQNLLLSSILLEKKKTIVRKIERKILEVDSSQRKELRYVLSYIQETLNLDEDWEDFLIHFREIHPDFYEKALNAYPNLTNKDIKHMAFIKLGLTSDEISKTMLIKKESLRVVRSRLKKKLNLGPQQDLTTFIQNF